MYMKINFKIKKKSTEYYFNNWNIYKNVTIFANQLR